MPQTTDFDDIRPYDDSEVKPTIERLLADNEFIDVITRLKMPKVGKMAAPFLRGTVRKRLTKETSSVDSVLGFQSRIEPYLGSLLDRTVSEQTVSGLQQLDKNSAYLFVSNHRDIVMDPALVNWSLYHQDFQTLRIAIGDNLLSKPFASDLMRLNKCFIVNRSAKAPREKLKAARHLSSYMRYALLQDRANLWIAQREGRAKDSLDKTNPAIFSMIGMSKDKGEDLSDYVKRINVVPVSISYEWDPCDQDKARELSLIERAGSYTKAEHEDVQSIAKGIMGYKGRVHLAFGEPLFGDHLTSADAIASALDDIILRNYVLQPSHCVAYQMLENQLPNLPVTAAGVAVADVNLSEARKELESRLQACNPDWRTWLLKVYANPVYAKLAQASASTENPESM